MAESDCRKVTKDLISFYGSLAELETIWLLQGNTNAFAKLLLDVTDDIPSVSSQTKERVKAMLTGVIEGEIVPLSKWPAKLSAIDYKATRDHFLNDAIGAILEVCKCQEGV